MTITHLSAMTITHQRNQPLTTASSDLARQCELRLGQIVHVAMTLELRRLSCPAGHLTARRSGRLVLALTDTEFWLLELRRRLFALEVGAPVWCLPRQDLVANWRRLRLTWPPVWRAEFCWPYAAVYIEAELIDRKAIERVMGLLAADELGRQLVRAAPAAG